MENNFIHMAASAGHAVAYTIGPIIKHIIDCVQQLYVANIGLYKHQLSLACRRNKVKMSFIWNDNFLCQKRHLL